METSSGATANSPTSCCTKSTRTSRKNAGPCCARTSGKAPRATARKWSAGRRSGGPRCCWRNSATTRRRRPATLVAGRRKALWKNEIWNLDPAIRAWYGGRVVGRPGQSTCTIRSIRCQEILTRLASASVSGKGFAVVTEALVQRHSRRAQCSNNLKQTGLAVHSFHNSRKILPPSPASTPSTAISTARDWSLRSGRGATVLTSRSIRPKRNYPEMRQHSRRQIEEDCACGSSARRAS